MGLDTQADVRDLLNVQDGQGDPVPPSNENRQQEIVDAVGNPDGGTISTYTTSGTTAEQLPDLAIPDGVTALIVYLPGNSGDVYLGDDTDQFVPLTDSGHTFWWEGSSTSALHIRTNTSGDGVGIIFEGVQ
jgi:hypothetical protein